jgi:hypothetical protein
LGAEAGSCDTARGTDARYCTERTQRTRRRT